MQPPKLRCRQIGDADRDAVAQLLARGFPARPLGYWTRGLARLAARDCPPGLPRFGYLMENEGTVVGVLLLIFTALERDGAPEIRCNLSSWFVEPGFRTQAAMLSLMPFRHKGATFLNISSAPNTWATIEAQGFRRYAAGQVVATPALAPQPTERLSVVPYREGMVLPEAGLMADHARFGCLTLVGHGPDGPHPFVFLPLRARQGRVPLPAVQLVYCRSLDDLVRFAAPIGRHFLGRGRPFLIVDADGQIAGLPGAFLKDRARKYFKGARAPRLGDLAYTEFTLFGA